MYKITNTYRSDREMVTPYGTVLWDISFETSDPAIANYFRNYGLYSEGQSVYTVEEIPEAVEDSSEEPEAENPEEPEA